MSVLQNSAMFVMRELVQGAVKSLGGSLGEAAAQGVSGFLSRQFADHSQRLILALRGANDRAWRALEISLEGDSWWGRIRGKINPAEDRVFAAQVQTYLQQARLDGISLDRGKCLEELRDARRRKLLDAGQLTREELARQADHFVRYRDPTTQLDLEMQAARTIANILRPQYKHLAAFLHVQVHSNQGESLLAVALRYFFRRAIEDDPQLAKAWSFAQLEKLKGGQEQAFAALHDVLQGLGNRLEGLLGEIQETVQQTRDAVLDIQAEQRQQGGQLREMYQAVIALQQKLDLCRSEVRPGDSQSIQSDDERQVVRQIVARYRALPPEQRRQMPALLNGIGKLEVASGDFQSAEQDFRAVAQLVHEPAGQGEAYINAYRAALERRDWEPALRLLRAAVQIDPARFSPFPFARYEPVRILGGGGFGVAFLCEHRELRDKVVVKSLFCDHLDRGSDAVLDEARVLWKLDHPSIIRLSDCGYADPQGKARPYLVMQFFEGETLEEVARREPLGVEELIPVARRIAEGLQAAHACGVLHRDIKPANVLVRRREDEWEVKLIDFGLAVRQSALGTVGSGTLAGSSIAGTIDYAAPEQMGRLPGVAVSARSDVYGFGKTCCFALFGRATPLRADWGKLNKSLGSLLESCLQERPNQRPGSMDELLHLLSKVRRPRRARKGAATEPEDSEPADAIAEAERLLAEIRRKADALTIDRLGAYLLGLRMVNVQPDRLDDLVHQTRSVLRQALRPDRRVFSSSSAAPNLAVLDSAQARALSWEFRLSLWPRTVR